MQLLGHGSQEGMVVAPKEMISPRACGRLTWAEVDLEAIAHNLQLVRALVGPEREIMAVVKADAYGHGAVAVARKVLEAGANWLGVALPEEGIALREAGIRCPILVLGPTMPQQARQLLDGDLSVSLYSLEMAMALHTEASRRGVSAKVHVKVDTGMGRLGLEPAQSLELLEKLRSMPRIRIEGLYTHLATADDPDPSFALKQLDRLLEVDRLARERGIRVPFRHAANSAALLTLPESRLDLVRPGIMIYGCDSGFRSRLPVELRPALAWKTLVAHLRELSPGESVSYGRTFVATRPTVIGVLPVGYADGLPRRLSNRGEALVRGRRVSMVGSICMDVTMVDLTHVPGASVGDEVVLIGRQGQESITADHMAQVAGTIPYEILCGLTPRVPRYYLDGPQQGKETG